MNRILVCRPSSTSRSPQWLSPSSMISLTKLHHLQQQRRWIQQYDFIKATTTTRTRTTGRIRTIVTHETTTHSQFPTLFSPLTLPNGIVLPNRVLMGSMHTGLEGNSIPPWFQKYVLGISSPDHKSLDAMATYFQERAQGGVALMVTGGISPNRSGWTGLGSAHLMTSSDCDAHVVVTNAVHSASAATAMNGHDSSKICLQILHTGRYAYHPWAVSASATKSPISPFAAKELTERDVQQTIDDFVRCATLAREVGYDGVEIMASEGYLLSQFLSPRTNHRTDAYGGPTLEGRARLPLQILEQIRKACGDDFIIIFRLSLLDLVDGGLSWEECIQMAQWIEQAGATILNTGIGWHESRIPTIATCVPRAAYVAPTAALKATGLISIPLVATNRINMPQVAEDILRSEQSDMVSMARPFLADPNFLLKAWEGRPDEINTCIGCNQACLDHAFVGKTASCLVHPRAGHETTLPLPTLLPPEDRKRLVVIGAGPAGCALSLTAAQRGHHVTLYDTQSELGGQFHMAKRIPGKEEFHETLRYFRTMLKKYNVQLKLNTTITKQDMDDQKHTVDKWIVATGVHPRKWNIEGSDHPNVLSYVDVLRRNIPVGKRVAVIGAGGIGFDVAEFLLHHDGTDKTPQDVSVSKFWAEWNIKFPPGMDDDSVVPPPCHRDKLYLLQRKKGKLGATLGRTTGWIHRAVLSKATNVVEQLSGVQYDRVDENGHLHLTLSDGITKRVLEVDHIVVCAGQEVNNSLLLDCQEEDEQSSISFWKDRVYTIGGAYQAGELDAKRAIDMGTRLAMDIHLEDPTQCYNERPPAAEEKMYQWLRKWIK